jgi:hypothetical protein
MNRHYFITDDLDDLQLAVAELKEGGLSDPHLHVLSRDDAAVETHPGLTPVEAVLKKNVVRGTEIGAVIGVAGAGLVLGIAYASGLTGTVGWVPFLFLALVVLGFCTWEGGLFGIQESHTDFTRFQKQLDLGKHVFFVDQPGDKEQFLNDVVGRHPKLRPAGKGSATPEVLVEARKKFNHVMQTLP